MTNDEYPNNGTRGSEGQSGRLIVISGPSGSGKSTILKRLLELEGERLKLSISATTRPPREGEADGVNYEFLSPDEFARRREAGEFLESAEVYPGLWYGTLRETVATSRAGGKSVILEIDVQGMRNVVEQFPDAVTIFIRPPSMEVLEQRLRARRSETEDSLRRRLEVARREIAMAESYKHQVVNHSVEETVGAIREILEDSESA